MAFTRVNPPGFSFGGKLTHAQMNQLDIDHANALDKTIAGDELEGIVTMANGASIRANTPGATIIGSVANAVQITALFGLNIATAQGLVTSVPGGFVLGGGSSDYPVMNPARPIPRGRPMLPHLQFNTGWAPGPGSLSSSSNNWSVAGPATTQNQPFRLDQLIDGSTLTSVAISFFVGGTHAGGLPANLPTFSVQAVAYDGTPFAVLPLNSTDTTAGLSPSPASGAAWHNANAMQTFVYTCNQHNVVDTEKYLYLLQIVDENGSGSELGNGYFAATATMTVGKLAYA